jgi:hypothetical protein
MRLRAPRAAARRRGPEAEPRLATTAKFDSNRVSRLGRRYGFQGRLYAHAVVVANDLFVAGASVRDWAFVPRREHPALHRGGLSPADRSPAGRAFVLNLAARLIPRMS